jgi:uncharacterized protein YjdB
MKKNLLFCLVIFLTAFKSITAFAQLPTPVYSVQDAIPWDFEGENGKFYNSTATSLGYPEGVPDYYSWKFVTTGVRNVAASISGRGPQRAIALYNQVYKHVPGDAPRPNCRVECGPMIAYGHLISTGKWVEITRQRITGAAFVEDFFENRATGADQQILPNDVLSVRSGIGNASPQNTGDAGGVDSRGVGYNFHGFAERVPIDLSEVDALLAVQQMRCVGPDAGFFPYIADVGIDSWQSTTSGFDNFASHGGISGGRFKPVTEDWQWFTNYVGPDSLRANVPDPAVVIVTPVTGVTLSPSSASLVINGIYGKQKLDATLIPFYATNKKIIWTSSNTNVAVVTDYGLVTGVGAGTATITATTDDGGKKASSTITVFNTGTGIVNVGNDNDGVTKAGAFNLSRPGDYEDDEYFLTAPGHYVEYAFYGEGVDVIGFKPGRPGGSFGADFTIFIDGVAKYSGNSFSDSTQYQGILGSVKGLVYGPHTVRVQYVAPTGDNPLVIIDAFKFYTGAGTPVLPSAITVTPDSSMIGLNDKLQLTPLITPLFASDKTVKWISNEPEVATVDSNGVVTGVSEGKAKITALTANKKVKAKITVFVKNACGTYVNVGNDNDGITKNGGFNFNRDGDYNGDEHFMTSPGHYCEYTFTGVGVNVIGFKPGGSYGANYVIKVDDVVVSTGNTTSDKDKYQQIFGGKLGLAYGSHTVRIEYVSGIGNGPFVLVDAFKIYTKCEPQVVPITSITVSPASATIKEKESKRLTTTITPANATQKELKWTSSDKRIASVDDDGVVTGKKAGTVTITASAKNANISASSVITVESADCNNLIFVNPNPLANGKVKVSLQKQTSEARVTISTVQGNLIYESKLPVNKTVEIERSRFNKGIYVVTVTGKDFLKSVSLIVE